MATAHSALGKYRGRVGNLVFKVANGKQIVAERPSGYNNPKTAAQSEVRTKFKLSSQFTGLWDTFLTPYVRKKIRSKQEARSKIFSAAYQASYINTAASLENPDEVLSYATMNINTFANILTNAMGYIDQRPTLTFDSTTQSFKVDDASADNPTTALYQIVSFDKAGNVTGVYTDRIANIVSPAAQTIPLPVTSEEVFRYDTIVYTIQVDPNVDDATYASLTNLIGQSGGEEVVPSLYSLWSLLAENAELMLYSQLASGSYLVTP